MTDSKAPELTLERIAKLEMLRAAVERALEAYSASNRDEALARNHDGANLVYMANLANSAPALLDAARRLLELESALEFMARTHVDCLWEDTEGTLRLAREFGWTPPGESK